MVDLFLAKEKALPLADRHFYLKQLNSRRSTPLCPSYLYRYSLYRHSPTPTLVDPLHPVSYLSLVMFTNIYFVLNSAREIFIWLWTQ